MLDVLLYFVILVCGHADVTSLSKFIWTLAAVTNVVVNHFKVWTFLADPRVRCLAPTVFASQAFLTGDFL